MQDGMAKLVSQDQILRRRRGQGNMHSLRSTDYEQVWQPYPVDPSSGDIYIHTYCTCTYSSSTGTCALCTMNAAVDIYSLYIRIITQYQQETVIITQNQL